MAVLSLVAATRRSVLNQRLAFAGSLRRCVEADVQTSAPPALGAFPGLASGAAGRGAAAPPKPSGVSGKGLISILSVHLTLITAAVAHNNTTTAMRVSAGTADTNASSSRCPGLKGPHSTITVPTRSQNLAGFLNVFGVGSLVALRSSS